MRLIIARALLVILMFFHNFGLTAAFAATRNDVANQVLSACEIARVDSSAEVPAGKTGDKSFTFRTKLAVPSGTSYLIVTDLDGDEYRDALDKLQAKHTAKMLRITSFKNLSANTAAQDLLVQALKDANPKYVVFAPKIENFTEQVVLSIWQALCAKGGGYIDVYPAFLVAPSAGTFKSLIDRCTENSPMSINSLHPVVFGQYTGENEGGTRAVKKAKLMSQLFQALGSKSSTMVVRTRSAGDEDFSALADLGVASVGKNGLLSQLPDTTREAMRGSRLLVLFGHGISGITCSLDVNAFADVSLKNDIVLCGSCFSCAPVQSDFPQPPNSVHRQPFFCRAIENGATVVYGNMNTNGGFPQLYVILESMINGESVGEAYQRLLNAMLAETPFQHTSLVIPAERLSIPQAATRHSSLLYIMIGDPAAHPIAAEQ